MRICFFIEKINAIIILGDRMATKKIDKTNKKEVPKDVVPTKKISRATTRVKDGENDNFNDKILIEIAAYHDPELLNTVNSALIQADNKDRVYFGICYQGDDLKDYYELKKIKNCKIIYMTEEETRGLCYARYMCQSLIEDEKYIYQIDSHMRFVKHWDTKMIENLLSFNDKKAIISNYPPGFTDEMFTMPLDDPFYDNPSYGTAMHGISFHPEEGDYFMNISSEAIEDDNPKSRKRSAFISGGNFFSFSEVHKEVRNDPKMFFYGDEIAMSIRLFTYGWNVYNMGISYIYHQYCRKGKRFAAINNFMDIETDRYLKLIQVKKDNGDLGEYGLGNVRTFQEFQDTFGLDFNKKIVYMNAETSEFDNENFKGKISFYQRNLLNAVKEKELNKKDKITVLVVDLFGDYQKCIDSCQESAEVRSRIKYIVGSVVKEKEKFREPYIEDFITFEVGTTYCEILAKISEKVPNSNVMIIDSGMRMLKDWDTSLCESLRTCGSSSALTSWVWYTEDDKNYGGISTSYFNAVKGFKEFNRELPVIQYDATVSLQKKKHPYFTPFISDGFLFLSSKSLEKVKIDPNLNYDEHKMVYSARLWTHGINIYYPKMSYVLRVVEENLLNGPNHDGTIGALFGRESVESKYLEEGYPYVFGNERPLWTWIEAASPETDYEQDEEKDS